MIKTTQALREAYRDMDTQGMFPADWACRKCGRRLNADGNHPAELYAGTFTGLCYGCEAAGPYIERMYPLDGARRLSYPPSSPSWRRDRETYIAYADCASCSGTGIRSTAHYGYHDGGGMRRSHCEPCSARFYGHPVRVRAEARRMALYRAAEAVWQAELARIARTLLPRRAKKKEVAACVVALTRSPRIEPLKRELLARHKRASARLAHYAEPVPIVPGFPA